MQELDWFDPTFVDDDQFRLPDLIIAADVIYDSSLFHALCQTIDRIFTKCQNQCKMLLVNAVRNEKTQIEFFDLLSECLTACVDETQSNRNDNDNSKFNRFQFAETFAFRATEEKLVPPMHFYWESHDICPIKLYAISRSCDS